MKEYTWIKQSEHSYICKDNDMVIYHGEMTSSQGYHIFTMYNAFHELLFTMKEKSTALRLWHFKTKPIYTVFETKAGTLSFEQEQCLWDQEDVHYRIIATKHDDQVDLLFFDRHTLLGYVRNQTIKVIYDIYGGEICAMWMVMQMRKTQNDGFISAARFLTLCQEQGIDDVGCE